MGLVEDAQALRTRLDAAITAGEASEATRRVLVDAIIAPQVRAGDLTDAEVEARAAVFPPWEAGVKVAVGDLFRWDGTVVEVVQAHTTQSDWTPDKTPALWRVYRTPAMTAWQPGIAVKVGETFTFEGASWQVVQAHTTQSAWVPDKTPSLWKKV